MKTKLFRVFRGLREELQDFEANSDSFLDAKHAGNQVSFNLCSWIMEIFDSQSFLSEAEEKKIDKIRWNHLEQESSDDVFEAVHCDDSVWIPV
jgi:hypothetical protein